jgi:hypothetical protein
MTDEKDIIERFNDICDEIPMEEEEVNEILDLAGIDPEEAYKQLLKTIREKENSE